MKYELTLVVREKGQAVAKEINRVQSDTIISLLAQFQLVIAHVMRREAQDEIQKIREQYINDDEIPF